MTLASFWQSLDAETRQTLLRVKSEELLLSMKPPQPPHAPAPHAGGGSSALDYELLVVAIQALGEEERSARSMPVAAHLDSSQALTAAAAPPPGGGLYARDGTALPPSAGPHPPPLDELSTPGVGVLVRLEDGAFVSGATSRALRDSGSSLFHGDFSADGEDGEGGGGDEMYETPGRLVSERKRVGESVRNARARQAERHVAAGSPGPTPFVELRNGQWKVTALDSIEAVTAAIRAGGGSVDDDDGGGDGGVGGAALLSAGGGGSGAAVPTPSVVWPLKPASYSSEKLVLQFVDVLTYPRPARRFSMLIDRHMRLGLLREMMAAEVQLDRVADLVLLTKGRQIPACLDERTLKELKLKDRQQLVISKVLGRPADAAAAGAGIDEKNKQFVGDLLFGHVGACGGRDVGAGGGGGNGREGGTVSIVETFRINHGYQILGRTLEFLVVQKVLSAYAAEVVARRNEAALLASLEEELLADDSAKGASSKASKRSKKKEREKRKKEEVAAQKRREDALKEEVREAKVRAHRDKVVAEKAAKKEAAKAAKAVEDAKWQAEQAVRSKQEAERQRQRDEEERAAAIKAAAAMEKAAAKAAAAERADQARRKAAADKAKLAAKARAVEEANRAEANKARAAKAVAAQQRRNDAAKQQQQQRQGKGAGAGNGARRGPAAGPAAQAPRATSGAFGKPAAAPLTARGVAAAAGSSPFGAMLQRSSSGAAPGLPAGGVSPGGLAELGALFDSFAGGKAAPMAPPAGAKAAAPRGPSALSSPFGGAAAPVPSPGKYCTACGRGLAALAKFCSDCGTPTAPLPPPPVSAPSLFPAPASAPAGPPSLLAPGPSLSASLGGRPLLSGSMDLEVEHLLGSLPIGSGPPPAPAVLSRGASWGGAVTDADPLNDVNGALLNELLGGVDTRQVPPPPPPPFAASPPQESALGIDMGTDLSVAAVEFAPAGGNNNGSTPPPSLGFFGRLRGSGGQAGL